MLSHKISPQKRISYTTAQPLLEVQLAAVRPSRRLQCGPSLPQLLSSSRLMPLVQCLRDRALTCADSSDTEPDSRLRYHRARACLSRGNYLLIAMAGRTAAGPTPLPFGSSRSAAANPVPCWLTETMSAEAPELGNCRADLGCQLS